MQFELRNLIRALLLALTIALAAVIVRNEIVETESPEVGSACAVPTSSAK